MPAGRDPSLVLRTFGSLDDDGFSVAQSGRLSLHLHRGRVTDRVIANPFG